MVGVCSILRSGTLWLGVICLAAIGAIAEFMVPRVPTVSPAAVVDIRHDRNQHDYSIVFSSRTAGLQGHAYVTLVTHPQIGPYHAEQVGFYSTGNPLKVETLFGGPGEVVVEWVPSGSAEYEAKHSLVLWLDRAQLNAAARVIDRWRGGKRRYILFQSDCINMLHDVATTSGLQAPRRLTVISPDRYVQAMIEVNVPAWARTTDELTKG